ncbi:MAG: hypothetical protein KC516_02925 [Nanoarchaeota archaeon]|nr:hypothetical protein [Nanoarchaeota archaeon]
MTSKDLTEKLSYEELSEEIKKIVLDIKKNGGSGESTNNIKDLRVNYVLNYDSYTKEEREKIKDKLEIFDQMYNDFVRLEYYGFVIEQKPKKGKFF